MLTREFWLEIRDKWPKAFWDDWLRKSDIRKDRACIRPEISRTEISPKFGKFGVSK
jgi:alpha-1,3-mannosyl-glycoprotein beta-1,2-N-acetylglucosaminyltransferase